VKHKPRNSLAGKQPASPAAHGESGEARTAASIQFECTEQDLRHLRENVGPIGKITSKDTFSLGEFTDLKIYYRQYQAKPCGSLVDGKSSQWTIRVWEMNEHDKPVRCIAKADVTFKQPVSGREAAEMFGREYERQHQSQRPWLRCAASPPTPQEQDVHEAQWKLTAKRFPQTVKLLEQAAATTRDARRDLEEQARVAYRVEGARLSGDRKSYYGILSKAYRGNPKLIRPEDHEMALNWVCKGYNKMKRAELAKAVGAAIGKKLPLSLYKRAEMLDLTTTSAVRPGPRPKT
jgi:hypothetical protein